MKVFLVALIASVGIASAWNKQCPRYLVQGVIDTAKDAEGLKPVVGLGKNNGNLKRLISQGRRQINWDAKLPFILPGDFFNHVVPRGILLETDFLVFCVHESLFGTRKICSVIQAERVVIIGSQR